MFKREEICRMIIRGPRWVMEPQKKLVILDVEGVLIPKNRYLFYDVGKKLGLLNLLKIISYGLIYELGLISLRSALKRIFRIFRGTRTEQLLRIFAGVPLIPGVEEVTEKLKSRGLKIALISSGLPTIVVQELASSLKADYAFGFDLGVEGAALTGEIWGEVIEHEGKLLILRRILKAENLTPKDCIVVADDRNNSPIFLKGTLKIGYNPDFAIRVKADKVVTGRLQEILPLIMGESKQEVTWPSKNALLREAIHASGILIPILLNAVGLPTIALVILIVTLLYGVSELVRLGRKSLPLLSKITRSAATQAELGEFATAPIFFALGILLTLSFIPAPASSAAIAIFSLGDSTASIFGRMIGRRTLPFNKGRTLEGSIIGFFFALLGGIFFINPYKALVGAFVAMVVESLPLPLNDNLLMPPITGAILAFNS